MTRPHDLEDAIQQALAATRREDYEEALRCLSFAFATAANHRSARRPTRRGDVA